MATILIVKTGSTYPEIENRHGNFEAWFQRIISPLGMHSVTWYAVDEQRPSPHERYQGIVITGSPAMVSDKAPWSEQAARFIANQVSQGVPVLGVCFGHQLLAYAMGGQIDYHPQGREIGTLEVSLTDAAREDILLSALPPRFCAHLTHMQSVISLPANATRLASSNHESTQAFRIGHSAWGVQFHPEFTPEIMHAYIDRLSQRLEEEGLATQAIRKAVRDTPHATSVLRRFAQLIKEGYFDKTPA